MKNNKFLNIGYWTLVSIAIFLALSTFVFSCSNSNEHKEGYLYYKLDCKIYATQNPTSWRHGKYHGVDKRWLLQSLRDTTLFCEWTHMTDSAYFSARPGDKVYFKYIRKDRFFHIKYRE